MKHISEEDDEEDDDDDLPSYLTENFEEMTQSGPWQVARTIYSTLTFKGIIGINKKSERESELNVRISSLDFSKLDFHKGHPDDSLDDSHPGLEDDDDFDDEPDSNYDPTKTSEGGIIMALINMQMRPIVKDVLPNLRQSFSNNMDTVDAFSCYGMHLNIPELQYFKGGFILKGTVDPTPIDETSCL